mmetsp:Transcript_34193/g.89195  ORF Transcript_34193/g.89195 Transcript_34193/m.89195 type:complete len:289 (+) Transcript_34193:2519-3385(+)
MLVRLQCMALDTSANLSQASARSILPARVLATRVPEVGTAREDRIRAAQLRQLPCLKPDAQRRDGGLTSVVLLASFTFVTDLLVCFTLWNRPTAQVLLVLVRAVLKAAVVITSLQLRLLLPRLRRHAVSANSTTQVHTDGRALFACGTALILLACLSSIGLLLQVPEMIDDTGYKDAVLLSSGPMGALGVLVSAVAMKSSGSLAAGLLATGGSGTLFVGVVWLTVGPAQFTWDAVEAVLHWELPEQWTQFPHVMWAQLLVLIFQWTLLVGGCIPGVYAWASQRELQAA